VFVDCACLDMCRASPASDSSSSAVCTAHPAPTQPLSRPKDPYGPTLKKQDTLIFDHILLHLCGRKCRARSLGSSLQPWAFTSCTDESCTASISPTTLICQISGHRTEAPVPYSQFRAQPKWDFAHHICRTPRLLSDQFTNPRREGEGTKVLPN
jgi:hypothetical protein